jgi:hypothetical protein
MLLAFALGCKTRVPRTRSSVSLGRSSCFRSMKEKSPTQFDSRADRRNRIEHRFAQQIGRPNRPQSSDGNQRSLFTTAGTKQHPTQITNPRPHFSSSLPTTERRRPSPVAQQPRRRAWPARRSKRASMRAAPSNSPGRVARVAGHPGEVAMEGPHPQPLPLRRRWTPEAEERALDVPLRSPGPSRRHRRHRKLEV